MKAKFNFERHEYDYLERIGGIDEELDGGTDLFAIKIMVVNTAEGNTVPMYGIFNRETGVREAEQRQYAAAKTWARVLTNVLKGEEVDDDIGIAAEFDGPPLMMQ